MYIYISFSKNMKSNCIMSCAKAALSTLTISIFHIIKWCNYNTNRFEYQNKTFPCKLNIKLVT